VDFIANNFLAICWTVSAIAGAASSFALVMGLKKAKRAENGYSRSNQYRAVH
jgi:hypothetical protein